MQVNIPYIRACPAPSAEAGVFLNMCGSFWASQNQRILLWKWFIMIEFWFNLCILLWKWLSGLLDLDFSCPNWNTDPSAFSRHWPAPLNLSGHDTTDPGTGGPQSRGRLGGQSPQLSWSRVSGCEWNEQRGKRCRVGWCHLDQFPSVDWLRDHIDGNTLPCELLQFAYQKSQLELAKHHCFHFRSCQLRLFDLQTHPVALWDLWA